MRSLNHLLPMVGPAHRQAAPMLSYRITDRLHDGRTARVSVDGIASIVAAWLGELGVTSPLVDELVHAVRCGDWPAAHALAEHLSVDVMIAD